MDYILNNFIVMDKSASFSNFLKQKAIAITVLALLLSGISCQSDVYEERDARRIKPWSEDQRYWQYKGEPILLLGGSDQDNLFNHPNIGPDGLEAHLDLLTSAGGNYLRNTMSSRDGLIRIAICIMTIIFTRFTGMRETGLYDLSRWNEDYWELFSNYIEMTARRDIIVQIEFWDRWDMGEVWGGAYSAEAWSAHPYNPKNNINYTAEETILMMRNLTIRCTQ
jgi:hypothetical protein